MTMASKAPRAAAIPGGGAPEGRKSVRHVLFRDDACSISLSLYPPGMDQRTHSHELPSLAVLLAGSVEEQAGPEAAVATAGTIGTKPEGVRHSNRYGPDGAILLSLTVHDPSFWAARRGRDGWGWRSSRTLAPRLAAAALGHRLPFCELATELLAIGADPLPEPGVPPSWLRNVRTEISRAPGRRLDELAAEAGIHRVHLCRSFSRWFGESVSTFRLRLRAEPALGIYLHCGRPAASAAAEAGFSDQSHFARTVKRLSGMTPGRLAALNREVTSIQDGGTLPPHITGLEEPI